MPKRQIVLATYGSPGDLRPFLAIGAELRERGYRVVVATCEMYRSTAVAAGLDFAPVRPDRVPGQRDPDFFNRIFRAGETPASIYRRMFLPALRESLEDTLCIAKTADAVVSHPLATTARLAAEKWNIPWVSTVMQPMGYLSAREPAIIGPPRFWATLRGLGPGPTSQFMRLARVITGAWSSEWRDLRTELGLPPSNEHPLWEGQHSPRRSLGLFPQSLGAPQPDWPPQAVVTGYPFYRDEDRALEPALECFLGNGEAPVVFTLGTTAVNDPGNYFEESLAAARSVGLRAVLVVGRGGQEPLRVLGDGAIAVPYAPHELLFPRARAIVHQGGIGTLSEALQSGKPMLIMPYGHDQADNAWRAARLGAARIVSRKRYRAAIVGRSLELLLRDPRYALAAKVAAQHLARERGVQRAADLIEAVLR